VTVQLHIADRVAAGERVPVTGERVVGQVHVGEGAVVQVPGDEAVDARGVVPEAHVVGARVLVPALGVEAVRVVLILGGIGRVGLVDAGELGPIVVAVRGVAVGGLGVAVVVGHRLDVGVAVVTVVAVLRRPVLVVLDLREALTPRAVLVRLGELAGHLLVQHLLGQAQVAEVGGLTVGRLGGGAIQRVEGVGVVRVDVQRHAEPDRPGRLDGPAVSCAGIRAILRVVGQPHERAQPAPGIGEPATTRSTPGNTAPGISQ
jgi:hypothetical protein